MRIAIILGPFYPVPTVLGGAVEKIQLQLAAAYARAGHTVTILSRRFGDFPREETMNGVHHIRVASSDRHASLPINLALDLRYALRAACRMPVSDIVVTNSFFLPIVLSRRKAKKIYVHIARFPKHQLFLYRRADRLQAISNAVADAVRDQTPSLARKVRVIGYPVPDRYFDAFPSVVRHPTVLYVGRIAREKGVHLLISAFCRLAQTMSSADGWRLRLVGPHVVTQGGDGDEYMNELRALAAPLGARCEFVGPVFDEAALVREYRAAEVFVYPSLAETGEAFGLAPLEAMASGCAVIVSALRCFDDFVVDGVNGIRFDHRTDASDQLLSTSLGNLVLDANLRHAISTSGTRTARNLTVDAIAQRMLSDFEKLMNPVSSAV